MKDNGVLMGKVGFCTRGGSKLKDSVIFKVADVFERMKDNGVLMGKVGSGTRGCSKFKDSVIFFKLQMCFSE